MKKVSKIFLMITAMVIFTGLSLKAQKIVGYIPSWQGAASSIQYSKLTHINYAFVVPNASGNGSLDAVPDPAKLQQIVSSAHAVGVKVCIAVGGWSDLNNPGFNGLSSSATGRTNFANNLLALCNQYGLDGVDIDWEYPEGYASNYALMMQTLGTTLHNAGKILTAAVPGGDYYGQHITSAVFSSVDFLNIMAYDGDAGAGHSPYSFAVSALNYWVGKGLPASKAVLGVPFYARPSWKTYATLLNEGASPNADYYNGDYYNGLPTIRQKSELAKSYGGIMIWELSGDATGSNSLLSAIYEVLRGGCTTPSAPSNLNGSALSCSQINLSWADNANNETGFSLQRSTNNSTWTTISLGANTTSYQATGLSATTTYYFRINATNSCGSSANSNTVTITTPNCTTTQTPYGGNPAAIPGTIEAENYDNGGEGVAFHDATTANEGGQYRTSEAVDIEPCTQGGYNVGWIADGEWLEYTVNVATAGTYKFEITTAAQSVAGSMRIKFNDVDKTGAVSFPSTGAWQTWQTTTVNNISLSAGQQVMRIEIITGSYNINKIVISSGNVVTPPTAPSNLAAVSAGTSQINLSWTDNSNNESGFRIQRSTDNANWADITVGANVTSYQNTGLTANTTYYYRVRAENSAGNSSYTSTVSAKTDNNSTGCSGLPAYPAGLGSYTGGTRVSNVGGIYECKPWPYSGWANMGGAYEPGVGFAWQDAWIYIGPCTAAKSAVESSPVSEVVTEQLWAYPNPANNEVFLNLRNASKIDYVFTNLAGQVVLKGTQNANMAKVNISALKSGIYFIQVNNGRGFTKILKK